MRYVEEYGIAVMAKYPADHPRHAIVPEWHAWAGRVFAFTDPNLGRRIEQNLEVAQRLGCAPQIRCLPLPAGEPS